MVANDLQVGGGHYHSGYQPWDFTMDVFNGCFFLGNFNKYVTRWRKKNGVEDLRKALHYLEKRMELEDAGRCSPLTCLSSEAIRALLFRYAEENSLGLAEQAILDLLARGDIERAAHETKLLIAQNA